MAIEIVSFPIDSMVDLSIATLNYQRVNPIKVPLNHHFPMVFPWFSHGFEVEWRPITFPSLKNHGGKSWDHGSQRSPQDLEEGNSGNMMIGHNGDIMWQEKWDNRGIFNLYIYIYICIYIYNFD